MTETRITLEIHDEWETDREEDVELDSQLDMDVDTHLTGLAWFGIVLIVIGVALTAIGSLLFILDYPERWYALGAWTLAESRAFVRIVVTTVASGAILFFTGASFYFYGRQTRGQGRSLPVRMEAT